MVDAAAVPKGRSVLYDGWADGMEDMMEKGLIMPRRQDDPDVQ